MPAPHLESPIKQPTFMPSLASKAFLDKGILNKVTATWMSRAVNKVTLMQLEKFLALFNAHFMPSLLKFYLLNH
jgi:hypothetical protein